MASLGKEFAEEDKAKSNSLKPDHAWHVMETLRRPVRLEQGTWQGWGGRRGRRGNWARSFGMLLRTFVLRQ